MKRISVIAPIYNEKENIELLVEKIKTTLKDRFTSYEIILVDDGSTDGSSELIEKIASNDPHIKDYHFTKIMVRQQHYLLVLNTAQEI